MKVTIQISELVCCYLCLALLLMVAIGAALWHSLAHGA